MAESIYSEARRGPSTSYIPVPIKKAPHIGHEKHLCKLTESGEYSLDEIKRLVKDAQFICKKCGRVAVADENLCEPEPIVVKVDKWEEMTQKMMTMPKEEQMKMMEQSTSMCICKKCPSYIKREKVLLFCGVGKSSIIKKEKGCICGTCPVVAHMGLTRLYYCTRGNEKEQRGM